MSEARSGAPLTQAAIAAGYDGVVLDYSELGYHQQEIVAFDPDSVTLLDRSGDCRVSNVNEASVRLTDTQLDVLRLIADGRTLGDYVPRYKPGARRGRGAFPVTIATRAAVQLVKKDLVKLDPESVSGYVYVLTQAGADVLARRDTTYSHGYRGREALVSRTLREQETGIGAAARRRVQEPLIDERIMRTRPIMIRLSGIEEEWALVVTDGKTPPNGYAVAGRVLIDIEPTTAGEPLAGMLWIEERGQRVITHVWVDPEVQGQGVGLALVGAYKKYVGGPVRMSGPFSAAGLDFARRSGAEIVEEPAPQGTA